MSNLRLLFLISICCLGLGLMSCASIQSTTTENHPEHGYDGGFGGDGGHNHQPSE